MLSEQSVGREILFVLEKVIELTTQVTQETVSGVKHEMLSKLKEAFTSGKYDMALAVVQEYKNLDYRRWIYGRSVVKSLLYRGGDIRILYEHWYGI